MTFELCEICKTAKSNDIKKKKKERAEKAYDKYSESIGGKSKKFDDLNENIKIAWINSVN